ncbi:hypothetical protein [Paenibacillus guangzhouensis]|uniref:hypothetical protein n=1 Tax=Paenibacillus guangzhouensis TaxID=1473112 RepID=UPI001266B4D1|nr:hypothetical protein [Paenibacillus guangzhouensis]
MTCWIRIEVPEPELLRTRMRSLAALDTILCDEDWLRVHRYEHAWMPDLDLGVIENGAGDHLYVLFAETGVLIKGFDHESPLSPHAREDGEVWPGMYEEVPETLYSHLRDHQEELQVEDVTCCLWRLKGDTNWHCGEWAGIHTVDERERDGGASYLLGYLHGSPQDYKEWAEDYFDQSEPLSLDIVSEMYNAIQVETRWITALNPNRQVQEVVDDLMQMGMVVRQTASSDRRE